MNYPFFGRTKSETTFPYQPTSRILKILFFIATANLLALEDNVQKENEATSPDPLRGIYALWGNPNDDYYRKSDYIVGGQVVVQWGDVEKSQGNYDFSAITNKIRTILDAGKTTFTVQVNGNLKPKYLFEICPYHPEKLSTQVRDALGTLMYWHPVHKQAYQNLIDALSDFLHESEFNDKNIHVYAKLNRI